MKNKQFINKIRVYKKIRKAKRGEYYILKDNYFEFNGKDVKKYIKSWNLGTWYLSWIDEIKVLGEKNKLQYLQNHKWWKNETEYLVYQYSKFYEAVAVLISIYKEGITKLDSRNNIITNSYTCITAIHLSPNNELLVYSRSCDLTFGYLADLLTIDYIGNQLNVDKIKWYHGCLHIYKDYLDETIKMFNTKVKLPLKSFNKRKEGGK